MTTITFRKLQIAILIFFTALIAQPANAKIWRVNNNAAGTYGANMGGTVSFPVFKQLAEVNTFNMVPAGDTIHLEGSNTVYEAVTLTKKLVIIGTGYLLPQNSNTSASGLQAILSYIVFSAGSEGSQLIGVYVGNHSYGTTINVSNITIRRCRLDYGISLSYNISDLRITENFFPDNESTASILDSHSYGFPTHLVLNNNIIERTLILPNNPLLAMEECKNNVFAGPASRPAIQMYVGFFQNNILVNPNATVILNGLAGPVSNPNISNNISALASTQFGTANNNIEANMANLFVSLSSLGDAGYQLKPNSTGSNNGSDGTDRGAFGGLAASNRYTLSGLPPIPVIYNISTSGVAGPSGLPVTIKSRTIK